MSESKSHEALVSGQFSARAEAYLASSVHAEGMGLEELVALARSRPGARVLDLGCGGGHASFQVAPHAREVVAYDLSSQMLGVVDGAASARGLTNLVTRQGAVEHLPFEDASFDIVMSRVSAHHWTDLHAALREAARVLKPGGAAAFVDTVSPGTALLDTWLQAAELLRDCSHVRNYSRAEWQMALALAGLKPERCRTYRVRLDFSSWVARMNTPKVLAEAIRALQARMSEPAARHFALEADGSFTIEVALFEAAKPS